MTPNVKVIALGIVNAFFLTAGIGFQKLNSVKGASPVASVWLVLAFLCFAPTFWLANVAYDMGGSPSLFIAVSALNFILVALMERVCFVEPISLQQSCGLGLIILGIGLVALGKPTPVPS
jgi:drug/metabolite transporter (DMT)-like permease